VEKGKVVKVEGSSHEGENKFLSLHFFITVKKIFLKLSFLEALFWERSQERSSSVSSVFFRKCSTRRFT